MKIVKVNNLLKSDGVADYKGLNLDEIVGGTQIYPTYENTAYFLFKGAVVNHLDVEVISQEIYDYNKGLVDSTFNKLTREQEEIAELKARNASLQDDVNFILETMGA